MDRLGTFALENRSARWTSARQDILAALTWW